MHDSKAYQARTDAVPMSADTSRHCFESSKAVFFSFCDHAGYTIIPASVAAYGCLGKPLAAPLSLLSDVVDAQGSAVMSVPGIRGRGCETAELSYTVYSIAGGAPKPAHTQHLNSIVNELHNSATSGSRPVMLGPPCRFQRSS